MRRTNQTIPSIQYINVYKCMLFTFTFGYLLNFRPWPIDTEITFNIWNEHVGSGCELLVCVVASAEDTNILCLLQWRTQEVHVYNLFPIYSIVGIIPNGEITPTKTVPQRCTLPASEPEELMSKRGIVPTIWDIYFQAFFCWRFFFWGELLLLKQLHVRKNTISSLILVVGGWAPRLHPSRRPVFHLPRIFHFEIFQGSLIAKIYRERWRGRRGGRED